MTHLLTIASMALFACASVVSSKDQEVPGVWAVHPITIDGNMTDWIGMPSTYFNKQRMAFGVSNDSAYVYLLIQTADMNVMRAIRMTGLTLWLDARGKKNKDLSFTFRGGPSPKEMREAGLIDSERPEHPLPDKRERLPEMFPGDTTDQFTITDKKLGFSEEIPVDGAHGPAIDYALDKGFCTYEFKVPLVEHRVDFYGMDAQPENKISIGIKWGGKPERHNGLQDDRGGLEGSFGGFTAGAFPGGGAGDPGMRDRGMNFLEKQEVWIKTVLAPPPTDTP